MLNDKFVWHAIRNNGTLNNADFIDSLNTIALLFPKSKVYKMDKNTLYFLRISGDVPGNKRREFEQTLKFVFNQLPSDCLEHSLSADVFAVGHYHFFSLWLNGHAMKLFMASVEFQMLTGAYFTLGGEEKTVHGPIADIQAFRVSNMN